MDMYWVVDNKVHLWLSGTGVRTKHKVAGIINIDNWQLI